MSDTAAPDQTSAPLPGLKPPRFGAPRTIVALILREMGTTYGRSPGGYLWAVLEPIGAIVLLSIGFSLLVRAPSLGTSFLLFYATGYLPFSLYSDIAQKVMQALKFSKALLAYPRVTWLDAILARTILNLLTGITVFCLLITGILLVVETRTILDIRPVAAGLGLAASVGLGVGMMNCLLTGLYPVWQRLWTIISRPLFLASGIFFLYEDMPEIAQDILWWNPLLHAAGEVRRGFYPTYEAAYVSLIYGYGVALVLIALALVFLRRHHSRVIQES